MSEILHGFNLLRKDLVEIHKTLKRTASALETISHSLQREGSPPYAGHVTHHDKEGTGSTPAPKKGANKEVEK